MGIHLFTSKMLSDVLEYPVEVPVKLALQSENFYISPSREKAPYYVVIITLIIKTYFSLWFLDRNLQVLHSIFFISKY